MCDLFGISFSDEVNANISLDLFQKRGKENPDGWGVAFYRGHRLQVVKEAASAPESQLFDFLERHIRTDLLISHVRRSTRGIRSYMNTHPFYRVLTLGDNRREYAFAHNGTLTDTTNLHTARFRPIGSTDSELLFCHLLDAIHEHEIERWYSDSFRFVQEVLQGINTRGNTMNCMFSDGAHLFCYSDENRHNGGLWHIARKQLPLPLAFIEDGVRLGSVDVQSANVGGKMPSTVTGHVVVTRKLDSSDWNEFSPGQLLVFRRGNLVFQG